MQQRRVDQSLVGVGLYSPTEAARLTGATVGQVRRWLAGYRSSGAFHEPLWERQIADEAEELALGFRDLVQVKVASALIKRGLSAQKVRRAIVLAQRVMDDAHPLTRSDFATDGATVFLKIIDEGDDQKLVVLLRDGQYVMRTIIAPSLRGVEYDGVEPVRWRPFHETPRILLDPARQFGAPLDDESGVPARVLAAAVQAEGSVKAAARVYRVSEASVRQSVAFEQKLAA